LNIRCIAATLLASFEVPMEAMRAVAQVPMLAPNTNGTAARKSMAPSMAMAITKATVALLDWIAAVNIAPEAMPHRGSSPKSLTRPMKEERLWRGLAPEPMNVIPRKMKPRPSRAWPKYFRNGSPGAKLINRPKATIGRAYSPIRRATICAVTVVPILAPNTTPTACLKLISPAFTMPTSSTVVTLLLCMMPVINAPVRTPFIGLSVILSRILLALSPAALWRPPLIRTMPYRNSARPPAILKAICASSIGHPALSLPGPQDKSDLLAEGRLRRPARAALG